MVLCFGSFFFFGRRGMWDLSSPTRGWTFTLSHWKQSFNHWTTREVLLMSYWKFISFFVGISELGTCLAGVAEEVWFMPDSRSFLSSQLAARRPLPPPPLCSCCWFLHPITWSVTQVPAPSVPRGHLARTFSGLYQRASMAFVIGSKRWSGQGVLWGQRHSHRPRWRAELSDSCQRWKAYDGSCPGELLSAMRR